jgi:PAS domain S-box-containing protein
MPTRTSEDDHSTDDPDSSPEGRTVRVLLVEDAVDVAEVTAEYLERAAEELSVAVAGDARTGLNRLEDERFDCVVSDHEMPGMDGLEFLGVVRERRPELPFVLLTGKGSEDLASKAISAGVTDYVQKRSGADHYDILAQRLQSAVDKRRAEREVSALDRINRTIRQTTQQVLEGDSRAEIERTVCETLADDDPYQFAWIGTVEDDRVEPSTWAGDDVDDFGTIPTGGGRTERGPPARAARTGEPQAVQNLVDATDVEARRESADDRTHAASASVPMEFEGTPYGLLNVYTDRLNGFDDRELDVLTELGETVAHGIHRAALTERLERQYETLFEESPIMAVTTRMTPDGPVVEECNRRFLRRLGFDRSTVVGQPLERFYTADSAQKLLDEGGYERALDDDFTREQRTLLTADGESVETLLRAVPREAETEDAAGTFALYVDISERKRLERENERLDKFVSVVSHDLRNPLMVIEGHAELIKTQHGNEDAEAILEATDRMEELLEDLLTLARQGEAVRETDGLLLGKIARNCWGNVDTGGASLEVTDELFVEADASRLQQLLENLIANAVEHGSTSPDSQARQDAVEHGSTSPGSQAHQDAVDHGVDSSDDAAAGDGLTIRVGALEEGFYVADDGAGIPADERDLIFETGYSTDAESTGFGLSIVAEIAEAHAWAVEATESDDGGARFEFHGVETTRVDG